jgi:hypothetical protein
LNVERSVVIDRRHLLTVDAIWQLSVNSGASHRGSEEMPVVISENRQSSQAQGAKPMEEKTWRESGCDFVLVDHQPPPRIELARERLLMSRLYLGLIQSMNEDYGTAFGAHSDSATFRTIGIYVFLRTIMCSPVSASKIATSLKLRRIIVVRRLQEMVKHGYLERVGNAYRVTDKVNIPDLKNRLQRRVDMIIETARKLSELESSI